MSSNNHPENQQQGLSREDWLEILDAALIMVGGATLKIRGVLKEYKANKIVLTAIQGQLAEHNPNSYYSQEAIESYLDANIELPGGDNELRKGPPPAGSKEYQPLMIDWNEKRNAIARFISHLPKDAQVLLIENENNLVLHKDLESLQQRHGHGKDSKGTGGFFRGADKSVHWPIGDNYSTLVALHEIGHAIDYSDGSFLADQPAATLDNAMDAALKRGQKLQKLDGHQDVFAAVNSKTLNQHLASKTYAKSDYSTEAVAELFSERTMLTWQYPNNPEKVTAVLSQKYPDLWPVMEENYLPALKQQADKMLQRRQFLLNETLSMGAEIAQVRVDAEEFRDFRSEVEQKSTPEIRDLQRTYRSELFVQVRTQSPAHNQMLFHALQDKDLPRFSASSDGEGSYIEISRKSLALAGMTEESLAALTKATHQQALSETISMGAWQKRLSFATSEAVERLDVSDMPALERFSAIEILREKGMNAEFALGKSGNKLFIEVRTPAQALPEFSALDKFRAEHCTLYPVGSAQEASRLEYALSDAGISRHQNINPEHNQWLIAVPTSEMNKKNWTVADIRAVQQTPVSNPTATPAEQPAANKPTLLETIQRSIANASNLLGAGDEATVFAVEGRPDLVVRVTDKNIVKNPALIAEPNELVANTTELLKAVDIFEGSNLGQEVYQGNGFTINRRQTGESPRKIIEAQIASTRADGKPFAEQRALADFWEKLAGLPAESYENFLKDMNAATKAGRMIDPANCNFLIDRSQNPPKIGWVDLAEKYSAQESPNCVRAAKGALFSVTAHTEFVSKEQELAFDLARDRQNPQARAIHERTEKAYARIAANMEAAGQKTNTPLDYEHVAAYEKSVGAEVKNAYPTNAEKVSIQSPASVLTENVAKPAASVPENVETRATTGAKNNIEFRSGTKEMVRGKRGGVVAANPFAGGDATEFNLAHKPIEKVKAAQAKVLHQDIQNSSPAAKPSSLVGNKTAAGAEPASLPIEPVPEPVPTPVEAAVMPKTSALTTSVGVAAQGYMTYGGLVQSMHGVEQLQKGEVAKGVANVTTGAVTIAAGAAGIAEAASAGTIEKLAGKTIAENFERANMALMLVQGAVEIATAEPDQKGMAAVRVTTSMTSALATGEAVGAVAGAMGAAGTPLAAAAGILLPIGAAMAAGALLNRAFELDALEGQHLAKMDSITPDAAHSHLRTEALKLQNTMVLAQFGDTLTKTSDGKIDFNDPKNLKARKDTLSAEDWKAIEDACAKRADAWIEGLKTPSSDEGIYVPPFANEAEEQAARAQEIERLQTASLQGLLGQVQLTMEAREMYVPKDIKLTFDANGQFDLANNQNLDALKLVFDHQREAAKQEASNTESISYFWKIGGEKELRQHIAQEEIRKTTDIAIAELNEARWHGGKDVAVSEQTSAANIKDLQAKATAMAKANHGQQNIRTDFFYVADTKGGDVNTFTSTDDRQAPIPAHIRDSYRQDYDRREALGLAHPSTALITQTLYKDGPNGEQVAYGLVVWHIVDQQEMQKKDIAAGKEPRNYIDDVTYTVNLEGNAQVAKNATNYEKKLQQLIDQNPKLAHDAALLKKVQTEANNLVRYFTQGLDDHGKDISQGNTRFTDGKVDKGEFQTAVDQINTKFKESGVVLTSTTAGNAIVQNGAGPSKER